jgi:pimeloyl-ACP methyl ester carboxylesterase
MHDDEITLDDRRTVGFTDYGPDGATPVVWCHGGPGSRREPEGLAPNLSAAGYRVIGIDRPGYGASTPQPDRTIAGWVPEGLAVLDALGIDRFVAVGVSTGGAYALALASLAPERVIGVVACCALTDMRWAEGKATMSALGTGEVWAAPDRDAALKIVAGTFGEDGSKMLEQSGEVELPPADIALLTDPEYLTGLAASMQLMFAHGVQGYTDDRLADGPGWGTFDVAAVRCPVAVIHGGSDTIVPVALAHHTAEIVPGATLRVYDELGHFSIITEVVDAVRSIA